MPKSFFLLLNRHIGCFIVAISLLVTPARAETIKVPFGWSTRDVRVYEVKFNSVRSGDLKGGSCTLTGQLRVEVSKRDKKSADMRFLLSEVKRDDACVTPSLYQILWLSLADVPLEAKLEPETANVAFANQVAIREKILTAVEESSTLFGREFDRKTRLETAESFRKLLFKDAATVAQATAFIDPFSRLIGEVFKLGSQATTPADLPSPFGGEPLPVTMTVEVKAGANGIGDFSVIQTTRFAPDTYKAALVKFVLQTAGDRATKSDIDRLNKLSIVSGSVVRQRIEKKTGWIIEEESETTTTLDKGTMVVKMSLLYKPSVMGR